MAFGKTDIFYRFLPFRNSLVYCLFMTFFVISCKTMHLPTEETGFQTDPFLANLLGENIGAAGKEILSQPDKYRLQIIYIQINRDSANQPSFKTYHYHVNPDFYFYPASTVKMPIAFTALEKLNKLHISGLNKYTPMFTDSVYPGTPAVTEDSSAVSRKPSIAQYIKKIFLVSDNDAANRLYEFNGQQYLNETLHNKGYRKTDILHRLDISLPEDQNRHTNPVHFVSEGREIYAQPEMYNPDPYPVRHDSIGKSYMHDGKQINEPLDFSQKNRAPLGDLIHILQSAIFPDAVPEKQRFHLTEDDYHFLYRYMSEFPPESSHPTYDPSEFPPAYAKFLLLGGEPVAKIPPYLRIFSKSGWAYGFLTDISYVADFKHQVEFMLAATLFVNSDGVLNDDKYDYDSIGKPFMKKLGEIIYQYELKRPKKYLPDLSRYKLSYGKKVF